MVGDGAPKTPFRANLLSLRTLLIFAAGFALALLLARATPGAGLFHPEGRIIAKDVVITALNGIGPSPSEVHGIAISTGDGFSGESDVWDAGFLNQAIALAQQRNSFQLEARITYVVPRIGPVLLLNVEPRD